MPLGQTTSYCRLLCKADDQKPSRKAARPSAWRIADLPVHGSWNLM